MRSAGRLPELLFASMMVLLCANLWAGCASADLDGQGADVGGAEDVRAAPDGRGERDTFGGRDGAGVDDVADPGDVWEEPDAPGHPDVLDVSEASDSIDTRDATPDSGTNLCVGSTLCRAWEVCDPASGACVECFEDAHCAGAGVCDRATKTCVECLSDADCGPGGRCHERAPVCVADCCTNVTQEVALPNLQSPSVAFDLALNQAGEPQVVYANRDTNKVEFTTQSGGHWLRTEQLGGAQNFGTYVRIAVSSDDVPHVLVNSTTTTLQHHWKESGAWRSEDLPLTGVVDPRIQYLELAADGVGGIHFVAVTNYSGPILYVHKTASGALSTRMLDIPSDAIPNWLDIALTSDHRPIVTLKVRAGLGTDNMRDEVLVFEKIKPDTWQSEVVGRQFNQIYGLGISYDDEPMLAYQRDPMDGLRVLKRSGVTWGDTLVHASTTTGFTPHMAMDSLGDAHIIATSSDRSAPPLSYVRQNAALWEQYSIGSVDSRASYPRIVVDADRVPRVLYYDSAQRSLVYMRVE